MSLLCSRFWIRVHRPQECLSLLSVTFSTQLQHLTPFCSYSYECVAHIFVHLKTKTKNPYLYFKWCFHKNPHCLLTNFSTTMNGKYSCTYTDFVVWNLGTRVVEVGLFRKLLLPPSPLPSRKGFNILKLQKAGQKGDVLTKWAWLFGSSPQGRSSELGAWCGFLHNADKTSWYI